MRNCYFIARSNPSFNIVPGRKMNITQFVNTVISKVYLDLHACLFITYILTYVLNSYDIQCVFLKTSKDSKEAVRCKFLTLLSMISDAKNSILYVGCSL